MRLTNMHLSISSVRITAGTAFARFACVLMLVAFASCAGQQRDTAESSLPGDSSLTPAANLQMLSQREKQVGDLHQRNVPPPPGVEPGVLTQSASEKSHLSLKEALQRLASDHEPTAAQPRRAIDAVAETAALRHFVRGRDAALADRHIVAITELNRALELDPDAPAILAALARSYVAMGNQSRAAQAYERLLVLTPDDSEAQLAVALAAAAQHEYARAAGIIAARRVSGASFSHDQGADVLADFTLAAALRHLGFDRAGIEIATNLTEPQLNHIDQTRYANQILAAYRGQSELWRWVGDAHCRLGEFENALEAYRLSGGFASPDPTALHPRVIYANLRLGRSFTAQRELLAALQTDPESVSERDVRLCAYVFTHAQPVQHLAAAVAEMYRERPDHSELARAAASLLPPHDSAQLLREFVDRRPRDLHAVGSLLNWLAVDDAAGGLDAAVGLTADLVRSHPDLSGQYIGKLFFAAPRPLRLVNVARQHAMETEPSPAAANIEIRTLALTGALGEAWSLVQHARARWPHDAALVSLELDLAVMLEEPALIERALDRASVYDEVSVLLAIARSYRVTGEANTALQYAELAVEAADPQGSPRDLQRQTLLELANATLAFAGQQRSREAIQQWSREARTIAMRALEIEHDSDDVHEFLLNLHGPNGPLQDSEKLRATARRLLESNPDSRLYARLAAEEAINHGRFDQALERVIYLYDSDPADTRALRLAITAWVRQGNVDAAMAWVKERLESRPGDPALLEAWAELMIMQQRTDEAAYFLQQALTNDPRDAVARQLLEKIYRSTGQPDKAFRLGEQRLLLRPRGVRREMELAALYAGVGMDQEAMSRIRWLSERIDQAAYDHLATVIAVLGRMDDASEEVHRMTVRFVQHTAEQYPDSPLQLYGAGLRSMGRLGQLDDAFDALVRKAAASSQGASGPTPQHALVWRELAQALIDDGQRMAAARALHIRLLADEPTEQTARDMLATFAVVADAAVPDGRAALTLTLVHELAARGQLPRLSGMAEADSIASVLFHASQIFGLLGNDGGSEALLKAVIADDTENATALNNLGYMGIEAGRSDEQTAAWIDRARDLASDDASILDTMGWLRYRQGRFDGDDGAIGYIQKSLAASGEPSAEVLDHLGDVQWRLGLRDAAFDSWRQAAALIDNPQQREETERNYLILQTRGWGLLVADPAELYNRDLGERLQSLRRKLQAVEAGEEPPVAATFAEIEIEEPTAEARK